MASEKNTTTINVTIYEGDEELFSLTREEKNNKSHDVIRLVADGMEINHSSAAEMVNQALDEIKLKISLAIGIQKVLNMPDDELMPNLPKNIRDALTLMEKREKDES
ncbi:MAG: hypothetical protein [Caudoviricetes sp.]|nr:MAG: hypothetical protein [Caudoviricetes sp.]